MWVMDTTHFRILGVPAYFFCAYLGFVVTTCFYMSMVVAKGLGVSKSMRLLLLSLLGMAAGAKLFGYLTGVYRCIGQGIPIGIAQLRHTGIVYYGGLFGLLASYRLLLQSPRWSMEHQVMDLLAVCIPLFHAISRIGCFFSGCCFGREYDGLFHVLYTTQLADGVDTSLRFPVQLLEAVFEFTVFGYLFWLSRKPDWHQRHLLVRYLQIYSIGRFFLEFLRGDIERGVIRGISFSQAISCILWLILLGNGFIRRYRQGSFRDGLRNSCE